MELSGTGETASGPPRGSLALSAKALVVVRVKSHSFSTCNVGQFLSFALSCVLVDIQTRASVYLQSRQSAWEHPSKFLKHVRVLQGASVGRSQAVALK